MNNNLYEAHRQWATRPSDQRFTDINALREAVHARRMISAAYDAPLTDLTVRAEGDELIVGNGRRLQPTNWAFGQFSRLLGAPAAFLRTLSTETTARVLNERLGQADRDAMKIMHLRGDRPLLQAVTSTKYGRIWDADVVDGVQAIVDRTEGRFYNPKAIDRETGQPVGSGLYASDHDVFLFLIDGGSVFDVGPRAQINRGFIAWNSEVGAKTLGLMTFLFNHVCGNHIIWGAHDVNQIIIRHSAGGPARFAREVAPALADYVKADPDIAAIRRAQGVPLKALPVPGLSGDVKIDDDWRKQFAGWRGFTRSEVDDAFDHAEREEGQCATLWDLTQGFTAAARDYEFIDARFDLEKRAGKLLEIVAA